MQVMMKRKNFPTEREVMFFMNDKYKCKIKMIKIMYAFTTFH